MEHLLTCVRKEHSYTVRREARSPSIVVQSSSTGGELAKEGETAEKFCQVCHCHAARYKCPRCSVDYCSLECYNQHGNDSNSDCKEDFFRNRTSQHVEMQRKERLADTKQMIQRVYEQSIEGSHAPDFSQEDLLQIMKALEEGDETAMHELMGSNKIRQALSDSLAKGELLDYVLDGWTPWWQPETHVAASIETNESDLDTPLDERLMRVAPLISLHAGPTKLPDLRFNLLDILHAICWTLRLYHGRSNAMECSVDAAENLVRSSLVLSEDVRWQSLPEVLSSCTTHSTRSQQNGGCNASSLHLINDMMQITGNNRYIAKALFEAVDLLREATTATKHDNDTESAARFRKSRKKIEFFLSWCREPSNMERIADLPKRIETWTAEWELKNIDNDWQDGETLIGGFRISSTETKPKPPLGRSVDPLPLLVEEVSSRKK